MSEALKDALKEECDDNRAKCNGPGCETFVWNKSIKKKTHICQAHGMTHEALVKHYEPIHDQKIADEIKAMADAHNQYSASTTSSSGRKAINASVKTLFDGDVYPTYKIDQPVFDDAKDEIGDMMNYECIELYDKKYEGCANETEVTNLKDESDRKAKIKALHTAMNASIRCKNGNPKEMVDALKALKLKM